MPEQLKKAKSCPQEIRYLWAWYLEVRANGALTYQEVESWQRLTKKHLHVWEVDVLMQIDSIYWKVANDG